MAKNPFDNFFSGLVGGATAMGQRRALKAEGEEAPTFTGALFQGMQLGRTLPSTPTEKLNADRLKLEAGKIALESQLSKRKQDAVELQQFADLQLANEEAEQEKNDILAYTTVTNRIMDAFRTGGMEAVYAIPLPEFSSSSFTSDIHNLINDLDKTSLEKSRQEFRDYRDAADELGIPTEGKSTLVLRAQVDQKLGRYTATPTQVAKMIDELEAYQRDGDTEKAQLMRSYLQGLVSSPTTSVTYDPETDKFTVVSGKQSLPKPTSADAAELEEAQAIETLWSTINQVRSLVEQNPKLVGSTGELMGLSNTFAEVLRPIFPNLPQNADRLKVVKAFNTLKTQALMALGKGSLAKLTDKDAKILMDNIPELSVTSSPEEVMGVLNQLEGTLDLGYLLTQKNLNRVDTLARDPGPRRLGKLIASASRLNFKTALVDEIMRKAIVHINDQPDGVADKQLNELVTSLQENGWTTENLKPYVDYLSKLNKEIGK